MKNITDSCELISSRVDFKPTVRGLKPEEINNASVFDKFMDWGQNEGFKRNEKK
jgi:hypothetical protein